MSYFARALGISIHPPSIDVCLDCAHRIDVAVAPSDDQALTPDSHARLSIGYHLAFWVRCVMVLSGRQVVEEAPMGQEVSLVQSKSKVLE